MDANEEVHKAIDEFRDIIGNPKFNLKQKRLAFRGLCHISFQKVTKINRLTETRLLAIWHEWEYLRAPLEPDFPNLCLGNFLILIGEAMKKSGLIKIDFRKNL